MLFNKNHIVLGIILGICVPVIGYALFQILFETLTSMGIMEELSASSMDRRVRTLALLGICSIIIPFEIYRKKRYEKTMRGMVFPTIIYVGIWIYRYYDVLFVS